MTFFSQCKKTPMDELVAAIRDAKHERVASLIKNDSALVHAYDPNSFGATPLIHAVNCDDRPIIDILLDAGADINQRSDWWAGSFGVMDSCSRDIADYLISRGAILTPHAAARLGRFDALRDMLDADPSLVHARGGDGQMPLHFASTMQIADLLLDCGSDIDARDVDHESTAAQWLATSHPEVSRHLVARGCATDPFLAAAIGDVALLKSLAADEPDLSAVRINAERYPTSARAASQIYFYTIGEGCTLMHAAASANQPGIVRALGELGLNPNERGGYDNGTPLHQAAWNDRADAAAALLDIGADPELRSGHVHNNEPIGWAIVGGSSGVVKLLVERGVNIRKNHRDDAAAGAKGAYREFKRDCPIESWRTIQQLING